MLWPLIAFVCGIGLGVGGGLFLNQRRLRLLQIEITELELEINQLKEFNTYCLNHAAGVLLTWEDYKESHGLD